MAVTSVTAIVTNFIVDGSTPANNNTFYVAFFANDGSYSSSLAVNADITQTSQQVCNAISTAVANAVNTALGTSLTANNVLFLNRPSDGTGTIASGTLASGSIGNAQVASGGFGSGAIGSGQLGWTHLSSGAVRSGHIGDAAVVSGSIASGSIASGHIASGFIFFLQTGLASGSVTSGEIGDNAVTSGNIASGQISTNHFSSGAIVNVAGVVADDDGITGETISGGRCVAYDASGALIIAMAGDPTRMPAMGVSIDNALSGQPLRHYMWGEIDSPLFNLSGQVGEGAWVGTSGTIQPTQPTLSGNIHQMVGVIGGANTICLGFRPTSGFITAELLASGQVIASGCIISGYVGNAAVVSGSIASGSIGTVHIASGGLLSGAIGSGQIGFGHLANASVQSGTIASGSIGSFHLGSGGVIRSGSIGSGAVTGQAGAGAFVVASGTIGTFDIGSGAVVSGRIASGSVGAFHIAWATVGAAAAASGAILSGNIASGQVGKFHLASGGIVQSGTVGSGAVAGQRGGLSIGIASGTLGHFDFGSGAIQSGEVASGQLGFGHFANASVQSGTIASGQVAGWHLASGVLNAISGTVNISGALISNKYVMGFDLSLNPVVGNQSVIMTWWGMQLRGNQQSAVDVVSGAVEAYGSGNVFSVGIPIQKSSGAVGLAIISASGQVGDMTAWYGSGGASGGLLGTVFAAVNASGTFRGSLASGMVSTYSRNDYEDSFVANEAISGLVAVALDSGGINVVRAQPGSGLRMPAIGVSVTNVVSGAICPFISFGKILISASGAIAGSGFAGVQRMAYVGSGGLLLTLSGYVAGASSGGGPAVAGTSGRIVQRVGVFISGGVLIDVDQAMTSGLIGLPGGAPSY